MGYGKFVMIQILQLHCREGETWARSAMDAVVRFAGTMCLNNHGCNVLSVAFGLASAPDQVSIVHAVKEDIDGLSRMVQCRYGHALVIKILDSCQEQETIAILRKLFCARPMLGQSRYGKLILRKCP